MRFFLFLPEDARAFRWVLLKLLAGGRLTTPSRYPPQYANPDRISPKVAKMTSFALTKRRDWSENWGRFLGPKKYKSQAYHGKFEHQPSAQEDSGYA